MPSDIFEVNLEDPSISNSNNDVIDLTIEDDQIDSQSSGTLVVDPNDLIKKYRFNSNDDYNSGTATSNAAAPAASSDITTVFSPTIATQTHMNVSTIPVPAATSSSSGTRSAVPSLSGTPMLLATTFSHDPISYTSASLPGTPIIKISEEPASFISSPFGDIGHTIPNFNPSTAFTKYRDPYASAVREDDVLSEPDVLREPNSLAGSPLTAVTSPPVFISTHPHLLVPPSPLSMFTQHHQFSHLNQRRQVSDNVTLMNGFGEMELAGDHGRMGGAGGIMTEDGYLVGKFLRLKPLPIGNVSPSFYHI
jgi:hypothetical protein